MNQLAKQMVFGVLGTFTSSDAEFNGLIDNTEYTIDLSGAEFAYGKNVELTYEVVDPNGCLISDVVNVSFAKSDFSAIVESEAGVCESGTVTLEATTPNEDAQIAWFDTETGDDAPIHVGERYTTISLTQTRTYYVAEYNQALGAFGLRKSVNAYVYERPTLEIGSDVYICDAVAGSYDLKNDEPTGKTDGVWSSWMSYIGCCHYRIFQNYNFTNK